ncbi:MAG: 6-phosphofructokinase [Chloroflexi bacterium]|nr:6-phosphofructokinase [Chloroflexota bacterium]
MAKRIGVLTGGGDAPGQNVCLKAITYHAIDHGWEVIGIRKGWEGLLNYDPDNPSTRGDNTIELTKLRVRDIDRTAGSYLHSSRLDPSLVTANVIPGFLKARAATEGATDLTDHIKRAASNLGLDVLIALGDRGALQYAARLAGEGVPVIGIPKTVHNDVNGSDYSLGFSTALARGVRFVQEMRAIAGSREEIAVIEILGRTSGLTTMLIGFLAGADRTLVPEVPINPERLAALLLEDKNVNPTNYAICVMSEATHIEPEQIAKYAPQLTRLANTRAHGEAIATKGQGQTGDEILFELAQDLSARVGGSGPVITEILENITGQRVLFQPLSYMIRSGEPDGQDLLGAQNFAAAAIHLIAQNKFGRVVVYRQGDNYVDVPIETVAQSPSPANVIDHYDAHAYQPKPGIIWAARV